MPKVAVVVDFTIIPEHVAAFEAAIRDHAAKTLATEPGCERFDVMRPVKTDNRFMLYELYRDEAAFEEHGKTPRLAALRETYKDWIEARKITLCHL